MVSRGPSRRGGGGSVRTSASGGEASCGGWAGLPFCRVMATLCASTGRAATTNVVRGVFTCPRAFACFSSRRSSAASSTCSMVAPGMACERPARAVLSFFRNSRLTLTWMRLRSAESGSISSRLATGRPTPPNSTSDVRSCERGTTSGGWSGAGLSVVLAARRSAGRLPARPLGRVGRGINARLPTGAPLRQG